MAWLELARTAGSVAEGEKLASSTFMFAGAEEFLHEVTLVAHPFLYRALPDVHQDSGARL